MERGPGVAVKSFSCTVQLIVLFLFVLFGFFFFFFYFYFFIRDSFLSLMSFFIQEYEWLTTAKREI